jgi:uncharacterized protein YjiS (DUF1127 family)
MRIASPASRERRTATGLHFVRDTALSLLAWVERVAERRRSRLALLEMTDAQLKDIGLSRADAYREGMRRPWE